MEYENVKRALDEMNYDHENLRRILAAKQDEMG